MGCTGNMETTLFLFIYHGWIGIVNGSKWALCVHTPATITSSIVSVRVLGMDANYTKAGGGPWWEFDVVTGEKLLDISFDPAERDNGTVKYTPMARSEILEITENIWKFKYQIRVFYSQVECLMESTLNIISLLHYFILLYFITSSCI